jgi:DNA topoisomerase-2
MSSIRRASTYREVDKNEHALLRPQMYYGSFEAQIKAMALISSPPHLQSYEDVRVSPALVRLAIELVCNAIDNVSDSRQAGISPGKIWITVNDDTIIISNEGLPLPVEKMKRIDGTMDWIPNVMFSQMLASSHYDDSSKRESAGMNGVGAKIANQKCEYFNLVVRDGRKRFERTWSNAVAQGREVVKDDDASPLVSITFRPNMEHFVESVSLFDKVGILRKIAYDAAVFAEVPVVFTTAEGEETFDHARWRNMVTEVRGATGPSLSLKTKNHRVWLFASQPIVQESYVNGTPTYSHGSHVNVMVKGILTELHRIPGLERMDRRVLLRHISFVLCSVVDRPIFEGACKDRLDSKCDGLVWEGLAESFTASYPEIVRSMLSCMDDSRYKEASKVAPAANEYDESTVKTYNPNRKRRLWIAEGISAMKTCVDMITALYGNRQYDGVLAIRGKVLNVRKHADRVVSDSEIVGKILNVLQLIPHADYSDPKIRRQLRYDEVVLASDADVDGYHIRALVIDMLTQLAPSLLDTNYFLIMQSPIIRLTKGDRRLLFYTLDEWQEWQRRNTTGWSTKHVTYCKGLGSSGPEDTMEDAKEGEEVVLKPVTSSEDSVNALSLAFSPALTELRKEWIKGEVALDTTWQQGEITIPYMIQVQLLEYTRQSLRRAIPAIDGFNESQRLAVWTALVYGSMKSDALLGKVLDHFDYKHGIDSLYGAIVGMAAGYPGTNNLPIFAQKGNFGSRSRLSKDRAGRRYTEAVLRPYIKYIFRDEDRPILEYKTVNGKEVEPASLLPIIPLYLVNGAVGIATGWATFIPCYNPYDVIDSLEQLCRGGELGVDSIKPWFRHHKGKVTLYTCRDQGEVDRGEDGEEWKIEKGEQGIRIRGCRRRESRDGHRTHITEIPAYVSTCSYVEELRLKYGRENVDNCGGSNDVDIVVRGKDAYDASERELGLVKSRSLSQMYILGENNIPVRFATPEEGIKAFYTWRLPWYKKRLEYQSKSVEEELRKEEEYYKYLDDVLSGRFAPRPEASRSIETVAQYKEWIISMGYSMEAVDRKRDWHTKETLERSSSVIETLRSKLDKMRSMTPELMMMSDLAELRQALKEYDASKMCKTDVANCKQERRTRRR